jgi:hypothetical protein
VGELVDDDVVLHGSISVRVGQGPNEHTADARLAAISKSVSGNKNSEDKGNVLRRRSEVSIVRTTGVLNGNLHPIPCSSALSQVVLLEVECGFGESIAIGDVMKGVDDVERVGRGSRNVVPVVGVERVVVLGVEVELAAGL